VTEATPGRTIVDQIRRGAGAFVAIVSLIIIAALVGGYIFNQQGLTLPGWVPVLGTSTYTVHADFQTGQAISPGQGQAVTIAGVKVGIIAGVDLQDGVAHVSMNIDKQYSPIYQDATMLLRPKSQLKDMTVEVNRGTPAAGVLPSGATLPVSQTAPDANLDELLASLDADTRDYLQLLINSAGPALNGRGVELSSALRRFDPTTRDFELISSALRSRDQDIATVTHNFAILAQAIGTRDTQLANLIRASDAVFDTFAQQNANVSATVAKLPGAFSQINSSLGKLTTTAQLSQKALTDLQPTAQSLAPAERANQAFFKATTPVIRNEIRPFVKAANPTVAALVPAATSLNAASPNLTTTFKVLGTFLNELAYNSGSASNPGYLFYLAWANHNLNSTLSNGDASGALLRSEFLFAPLSVGIALCGSGKENPIIGASSNQLNISQCNESQTGSTPLLSARPPSAAQRSAAHEFNTVEKAGSR